MHDTRIKMKDGREVSGPIALWRPKDGYVSLFQVEDDKGELVKFYFKDMVSCVTEGERISVSEIGNVDELERLKTK